jgi:ubiquinone/menaquinone biosynthesis C-methylase UbiE
MSVNKSDRELAFLRELYVSTDWGERFAELIEKHLTLPKKGRALYVQAGTGGHALALQERAGSNLKFLLVDESEESLELARVKAVTLNLDNEFERTQLDELYLRDHQFDLVIGDASLVAPERLQRMLAEMVRVAMPGGTVALCLVTSSSFGEFFSVYWEALNNSGLEDHAGEVAEIIRELPVIADVEAMAADEDLEAVTSWMEVEEFDYESGEAFLNSPLISDFLIPTWLEQLPEEDQPRVLQEITRIIDEERQDADFTLSIKATLLIGRKMIED